MIAPTTTVALIDGSRRDSLRSQTALEEIRSGVPVRVFTSGEEALAYLRGDGRYEDREAYPLPAMILMDLDLPMMSGFDVMRWLQDRGEFSHIPVALLTSSRLPLDLQTAFALGAQSYTVKPGRPADCIPEIRAILTANEQAFHPA